MAIERRPEYRGAMPSRRALAVALLCLAGGAGAAQMVPPRDASFDEFLARFAADARFRMDRIRDPLPVRIGDAAAGDVRREAWRREQCRRDLPPALSLAELKEKGLEQRVRRASGTRVEVVQFRPEARSVLRTYTFEKIKGLWYLSRFDDASR